MSKFPWTWPVAFACLFWGSAILFHQHHLSTLIPAAGAYLLTTGVSVMAVELFRNWRKR